MPRNRDPYETTVMLRITPEFTQRLDRAVVALSRKEREEGRARKVGRATVVFEAMRRGLPALEQEVASPPESSAPDPSAQEEF